MLEEENEFKTLYKAFISAFEDGNKPLAIKLIKKASDNAELYQKCFEAQYYAGLILNHLEKEGFKLKSLEFFDAAIKLNPQSFDALISMSSVYCSLKKWPEAYEYAIKASIYSEERSDQVEKCKETIFKNFDATNLAEIICIKRIEESSSAKLFETKILDDLEKIKSIDEKAADDLKIVEKVNNELRDKFNYYTSHDNSIEEQFRNDKAKSFLDDFIGVRYRSNLNISLYKESSINLYIFLSKPIDIVYEILNHICLTRHNNNNIYIKCDSIKDNFTKLKEYTKSGEKQSINYYNSLANIKSDLESLKDYLLKVKTHNQFSDKELLKSTIKKSITEISYKESFFILLPHIINSYISIHEENLFINKYFDLNIYSETDLSSDCMSNNKISKLYYNNVQAIRNQMQNIFLMLEYILILDNFILTSEESIFLEKPPYSFSLGLRGPINNYIEANCNFVQGTLNKMSCLQESKFYISSEFLTSGNQSYQSNIFPFDCEKYYHYIKSMFNNVYPVSYITNSSSVDITHNSYSDTGLKGGIV